MSDAKQIVLRPIDAKTANALVRRVHYSGKVVNNSQLHIGVFLHGKLEGAMQFGPSLDKRKIMGLVEGTGWNEFIELNRMAFSEALPRNSESRAIAIALRMLKKHAPQLKWVVTFADGAQCGDGTIYRASGFVLAGITRSSHLYRLPSGEVTHVLNYEPGRGLKNAVGSACATTGLKQLGATKLPGFQLRYLYFIDPTARQRLTVPILPFSEIARRGASMYRGKPRAGSSDSGTSPIQGGGGGATPTPALPTKTGR